MLRKFNDGWFTYYYDVNTGEKKFRLDSDGGEMIKVEKIGICKDCPYADIEAHIIGDSPVVRCTHEDACKRVEKKIREEVIAKHV